MIGGNHGESRWFTGKPNENGNSFMENWKTHTSWRVKFNYSWRFVSREEIMLVTIFVRNILSHIRCVFVKIICRFGHPHHYIEANAEKKKDLKVDHLHRFPN